MVAGELVWSWRQALSFKDACACMYRIVEVVLFSND
jgi:hypothetical protein